MRFGSYYIGPATFNQLFIRHGTSDISESGNTPTTFIKINISICFRNHEHRKLYNNNKPISLTFKKISNETGCTRIYIYI